MYVYANEQIEFYYDDCRMETHFSYCLKDPESDELFVQSIRIGAYETVVQAFLPGIGADTEVMKEYERLVQLDAQAGQYGNRLSLFSEEYRENFRVRYEQVKTNVILSAKLAEKCDLYSYRPEYTYKAMQDIRETGIRWLVYNERRRKEKMLEEIDVDWVVREIYRVGIREGREISEISQSIYRKLCVAK